MAFRIGQEVVCVDDKDSGGLLKKGAEYIVSGFQEFDGPKLLIEGVFNPCDTVGLRDIGWYPSRFRPKTSITIFEEIARKVIQGKRVKIDA